MPVKLPKIVSGVLLVCLLGVPVGMFCFQELLWLRNRLALTLQKVVPAAASVRIRYAGSVETRERAQKQIERGETPSSAQQTSAEPTQISQTIQVDGERLTLFQSSANFHATPPKTLPDCTVEIGTYLTDTPHLYYSYDSQTGEFGRNMEWCVVKPEFRKWVRDQIIRGVR